MNEFKRVFGAAAIAALAVMGGAKGAWAQAEVEIQFYFPVAVGGKAAESLGGLVAEYAAQRPGVKVDAVYAGSYVDAMVKAITASRGGNAPQLAVLGAVNLFMLLEEDLIMPIDDLITSDAEREWLDGFYPAFMANSQAGGKTYGIPFQRSTLVMFWNKEAFKEAGLDPDRPPTTLAELVEFGKKLTKRDAAGKVTQWGMRIPSSGYQYWELQWLIGGKLPLNNADGNKTNFDDPRVIEALQYWLDLSQKHEVMASGLLDWGATPKAFFEGESAIIFTSTGNLTNVRDNAPFDFGVGFMPGVKDLGVSTGGANFYIFKGSTDEQNAAALDFVKWVSAPEQAATWTLATGYVAPRPDAWETPTLKAYAADFPPAGVSRDQLEFAVGEFMVYEQYTVQSFIDDNIEAALTGQKTPEEAMQDAQRKADRLLKKYR